MLCANIMTLQDICQKVAGTHIASVWESLLGLYDQLDRNCQNFQNAFNVHCPSGCGTCCEHFIPELTEAEASLIAAYILFVKKTPELIDLLASVDEPGSQCPLYRADSDYHCIVYPARALVCRLFGACPSEDKYRRPVFRKCKYNVAMDTPIFVKAEDITLSNLDIATMNTYGLKLEMITSVSDTEPLPLAVVKAAQRLLFLMVYLDDGSNMPEPDTPAPIAS